MAAGPDRSRHDRALQAAVERFGGQPSINGIDLGFKVRRASRSGELAIRFYVCCKQPESQVPAAQRIPRSFAGITTDVIEATCSVLLPMEDSHGRGAQPEHRRRWDPVRPGLSISRCHGPAGTLGTVVYDNATGAPALLSNWHVLVGRDGRIKDAVLQPAREDGGREDRDVVGAVERQVLGLQGDAAIALLNHSRGCVREPLGTEVTLHGARSVRLGEVLHKSGRTSGMTAARVDGIGRYYLEYPVGRLAMDGFMLAPVDGGRVEISAGGDSGSVWFDPLSGEGVGLHVAGDTGSAASPEYAMACHLPAVLSALDVSLAPGAKPAVDSWRELAATWAMASQPGLDQLRGLLAEAGDAKRSLLRQLRGYLAKPGSEVLYRDPEGQVQVVLEGNELQLRVQVQELLPASQGERGTRGRRAKKNEPRGCGA